MIEVPMEWKSWKSTPLIQRIQLPTQPGIYVVVDMNEEVWYVGKSINLNTRWHGKSHHRYKQLSRTNNKNSYRIHWQTFPESQLSEKEQQYIDSFKPHLNYSRVRKYIRKAIQPNAEISRLLKILNKKTLLFPDIRSVILGFYTEIDESEEGILEEYTCIVVVIYLNDYRSLILNSYDKSFSKKGMSIKGCWGTYESNCGIDNPEIDRILVPVFMLENIVYEFVSYGGLLENINTHRSNLHTVEIANQNVLALKDTSILPALLDEETFEIDSQQYLRYRASEIHSILDINTRSILG
jgi:GIY-YIG catalytic domain